MAKLFKITPLVVDDDHAHRNMLMMPSDWGFRTEGAEDGEAAVVLSKERPFDLILRCAHAWNVRHRSSQRNQGIQSGSPDSYQTS